MKKFLAAASAIALFAVAAPAFAQSLDGSIGYSSVDADIVTLGAVTGRLSWNATPFLGLEGEASFGVKDDTVTVDILNTLVPVDIELKHQFAIYGTAGVPVSENARLFARIGYGSTKLEGSVPGAISGSDESINYGVGGQFFFDGVNGLRADYTKMDFRDGGDDSDVWSIAYVRHFQ